MTNFLLKDPDCILIHIPKTGGSSIRRGLWNGRNGGRAFGTIPEDWPDVFRFAFVRHPLERFVSAYADFAQIRGYRGSIEEFAGIVLDDSIDCGESRANREERIRHHAVPQTHPFNCLSMAQEIYRFEDYRAEVARLAARLGMRLEDLPHQRKTRHDGWQSLIPPELLNPLIGFYEQDFAELGYPRP